MTSCRAVLSFARQPITSGADIACIFVLVYKALIHRPRAETASTKRSNSSSGTCGKTIRITSAGGRSISMRETMAVVGAASCCKIGAHKIHSGTKSLRSVATVPCSLSVWHKDAHSWHTCMHDHKHGHAVCASTQAHIMYRSPLVRRSSLIQIALGPLKRR